MNQNAISVELRMKSAGLSDDGSEGAVFNAIPNEHSYDTEEMTQKTALKQNTDDSFIADSNQTSHTHRSNLVSVLMC